MTLGTKKRETRKSMHQPGWITLEGGFAARPCVVRDLSTSGAKLTIDIATRCRPNCGWRFARRQNRAQLRSGLAPRQDCGHQFVR